MDRLRILLTILNLSRKTMNKIEQILVLLLFLPVLHAMAEDNNGRELDRMHGLDTYDYGARQYDPILLRWDRMDPLCEKYYSVSPYAYCANNPVKYVDLDCKGKLGANIPNHHR